MTKQLKLHGLKDLSRVQKNTIKDFLYMCAEDNLEYYHTGSRLVAKTHWDDVDFVVKVDNIAKYKDQLASEGWSDNDEYKELEKEFESVKKNNINIILTQDQEYFNKWVEASNIVSTYQIKEKDNRIAAFGYVFKRVGFTVKDFQNAITNSKPEFGLIAVPF